MKTPLSLAEPGKKGKHKFCFKVEYSKPDELCGVRSAIDFGEDNLHWEEFTSETALTTEMTTENAAARKFSDAKKADLKRLIEHSVYNVVDDIGQPRLKRRWVYTVKTTETKILRPVPKKHSEICCQRLFQQNPGNASQLISKRFFTDLYISRTLHLESPPEGHSESCKVLWLGKCIPVLI